MLIYLEKLRMNPRPPACRPRLKIKSKKYPQSYIVYLSICCQTISVSKPRALVSSILPGTSVSPPCIPVSPPQALRPGLRFLAEDHWQSCPVALAPKKKYQYMNT